VETVVVLLYWVALYDGDTAPLNLWVQLTQHFTVSVVLWIDLLVGRQRVPDRPVALVMLAGVGYLAINAAVSLAVRPVYTILTWRNGRNAAAIAIGVLVVIAVLYFVAAALALARDAACARCCDRRSGATPVGGWFGAEGEAATGPSGPFPVDCAGVRLGPDPPCLSWCRASPSACGIDAGGAPDALATAFLPASLLEEARAAAAAAAAHSAEPPPALALGSVMHLALVGQEEEPGAAPTIAIV